MHRSELRLELVKILAPVHGTRPMSQIVDFAKELEAYIEGGATADTAKAPAQTQPPVQTAGTPRKGTG